MPRDVNYSVVNARLNTPIPSFNSTSISQAWTGTQENISPRRSIITKRARNTEPLDAPINRFLDVNGHSMFITRKVIGLETVPRQASDVYARKMMDFTSNAFIGKSPNFMDLGLSPAHTTGDLKSVISRATRIEGLKYSSDSLASKKGIEEVTFERVSEVQAYINYIKNLEFETMNVFERENISVT